MDEVLDVICRRLLANGVITHHEALRHIEKSARISSNRDDAEAVQHATRS